MSLKRSTNVQIETARPIITYDDKLGIQRYGVDNLYPNRMEAIIDKSTTGKACINIINKFIKGEGFNLPTELKKVIVGKNGIHYMRLNNLLKRAAREISYFNGVFFHLNYNLNFEVTSVSILPNIYTRLGLIDDRGNINKIYYSEKFETSDSLNKEDLIAFDVYNPNKDVIREQMMKAGGMNQYNGQVLYYNFDEYSIYPLSNIDVVKEDADTEAQIQIYKNKDLRSGFFAKYIVKTSPFDSPKDLRDFIDSLQGFAGASNNTPFMVLEDEFNDNPQQEGIKIEKLEQNIDDTIFAHYEESTANNIRKAVGNIPPIMVDSKEGSLISSGSGGEMVEAINYMNYQTEDNRNTLEELFIEIFSNFHDERLRNPQLYNIIPLGGDDDVEVDVDEAEQKRLESQAALKGSVGGVTALLQIQQSVSQGITPIEAGVSIVKEIYGIDEVTARQMLGEVKIKEDINDNGYLKSIGLK